MAARVSWAQVPCRRLGGSLRIFTGTGSSAWDAQTQIESYWRLWMTPYDTQQFLDIWGKSSWVTHNTNESIVHRCYSTQACAVTPKEKEGSTRRQKVSKGAAWISTWGKSNQSTSGSTFSGWISPALEAADTPQFITYPTDVLDVAAGEDAADRWRAGSRPNKKRAVAGTIHFSWYDCD